MSSSSPRGVPPLGRVLPAVDVAPGRRHDPLDPAGRDDAVGVQPALVGHQQAEAGEVAGRRVDAAERLLDAAGPVEVPGGVGLGTHRLPDPLREDVGQGLALDPGQDQAEQLCVDAAVAALASGLERQMRVVAHEGRDVARQVHPRGTGQGMPGIVVLRHRDPARHVEEVAHGDLTEHRAVLQFGQEGGDPVGLGELAPRHRGADQQRDDGLRHRPRGKQRLRSGSRALPFVDQHPVLHHQEGVGVGRRQHIHQRDGLPLPGDAVEDRARPGRQIARPRGGLDDPAREPRAHRRRLDDREGRQGDGVGDVDQRGGGPGATQNGGAARRRDHAPAAAPARAGRRVRDRQGRGHAGSVSLWIVAVARPPSRRWAGAQPPCAGGLNESPNRPKPGRRTGRGAPGSAPTKVRDAGSEMFMDLWPCVGRRPPMSCGRFEADLGRPCAPPSARASDSKQVLHASTARFTQPVQPESSPCHESVPDPRARHRR